MVPAEMRSVSQLNGMKSALGSRQIGLGACASNEYVGLMLSVSAVSGKIINISFWLSSQCIGELM